MKLLSGLGPLSSVLAQLMLVAFSAVALPETRVGGTKGNDWGSPSYPNWHLPKDCGGHEQRGALFAHTGAGDDRIWGNEGCDLIPSGKGNDTVYGGKEMNELYGAEVTTSSRATRATITSLAARARVGFRAMTSSTPATAKTSGAR